jgi:hypothetical protein
MQIFALQYVPDLPDEPSEQELELTDIEFYTTRELAQRALDIYESNRDSAYKIVPLTVMGELE